MKSKDLMIRGSDFYAIWLEERGLWSTDEQDAIELIDRELKKFYEDNKEKITGQVKVLYLWDSESGMIDKWHRYCQKQMRDYYHTLDQHLVFGNDITTKNTYATKKLSYPLEDGDISAYDKLISTLYSEEERLKIEWAIGSIVTGDSKKIQKFMVLYGSRGTGKSTILNIIQKLFDGYYCVFDAKALGSSSNSFALEAFKSNPLVAIQQDGDLSKIEDNTRLNSLVSHEQMIVNEKFKSAYSNKFECFLFMGTNKPVKITDGKSGLLRRLIDVTPTGNLVSQEEYDALKSQIDFELGAIASHCKKVYLSNKHRYDKYIPTAMMGASNDFYNFVLDNYYIFEKDDYTTLKSSWEMYKTYCADANVAYPLGMRAFKEELKNYFYEFKERSELEDGTRVSNYYHVFKKNNFKSQYEIEHKKREEYVIQFNSTTSIFDKECYDCFAQYATSEGIPMKKWSDAKTKLSDIDTSKLHYVKVPENHIVIDFDIKDENGNKSFEKNLEAASKFPKTYAELSKSGAGIHLHYIYTGDTSKLCSVYDEDIEIKVFRGNSSLRRKLTKCNDIQIATINSGLPVKGDTPMINWSGVKNELVLRKMIKKNLNKEYHPATKPSIDYIYTLLDEAYNNGVKYDVSDMRNAILAFAANSTNKADYCIKLVNKMKFKSEEISENIESPCEDIVFYDVEVFPNLFLVNWKLAGENNPVIRMINPTSAEIENLLRFRLVGFNCRRYDNHMLYARLIGYDNKQLFDLSQRIVEAKKGDKNNGMFGEAYNISYTDVYDFAAKKQSLKKWEIELGIHHQELGIPWNKEVPENQWQKVAEYCDNDVLATEAVFNHLKADFLARQILADLAGGTVNDTTNSLTTKLIFGTNKNPQSQFNYRYLATPVHNLNDDTYDFLKKSFPEMMAESHGEEKSLLPYFPGYKYEFGKSTYRGEEIGEGGYVYAEPGMYGNVALLDIASMHPHSAIAEVIFGSDFTKIFQEIVEGRVNIKHKGWDKVNGMFGGKLVPYIQKVINGEMTSKDLAYALKIAINSVYGLTSASFANPFRDPRNKDNIVAKRGALFMVNLKYEVQKRGFTVAHIKTDSIKIPDATPEIIKFVMDYGKRYGYTFEHEATYDRMCLVNDAVYIAKYASAETCEKLYGYAPGDNKDHPNQWTATGTQFAVPYVFKTLFSKEDIAFEDMCETKSVSTALYLDMNEGFPDVSEYEKERDTLLKNGTECPSDILNKIYDGHNYIFVGKVGQFCPIKPGCGGGLLVREKDEKYYAVGGSKGYRWLESEMVRELSKKDDIDRSYYDKLVDDAAYSISQYGDLEWFISDDPYIPSPKLDTPPWIMDCGKESCEGCPNLVINGRGMSCKLGYDVSDLETFNSTPFDVR